MALAGSKSRHRWWWIFGLLVAGPALVLAGLGLQALRVEQVERRQEAWEQESQFVRLADAALTNAQAAVAESLRRGESPPGLHQLTYDRRGVLAFPKHRVYFGPLGSRPSDAPAAELRNNTTSLIDEAQSAEAQNRTVQAQELYRRIGAVEPRLRPWAQFGLVRVRHRSGEAVSAPGFLRPEWQSTGAVSPSGLPVAILACAYVSRFPAAERAGFAPMFRATLAALRAGQWWLSFQERSFHDSELLGLLRDSGAGDALERDSQLDELAAIEAIVRRAPPQNRDAPEQDYQGAGGTGFLVLWAPSSTKADTWTGAALSAGPLREMAEATLAPLLSGYSFGATLRDQQGFVLWDEPRSGGREARAERMRSVPGWELAFTAPASTSWMGRRQLLWFGLILLPLLTLMAGLAMTARVMRQELELGRLQSEFIAGVSHEFKSPITSIRLLVERIAGGRLSSPQQITEYCDAVGKDADRLEKLVNRLLNWQRIEAGLKRYKFETGSLPQVAGSVIETLRPRADAKRITLALSVEGKIPEMQMDQAAMSEALENLIDNAVKYSPTGTSVTTNIRLKDDHVILDVADEGSGIDASDLPHVFDKFYRGRKGNQQDVQGSGLGLSLVKAAVEAHGGTVAVASEPDRGSTFSIRLPVRARRV